MLSLLSLLVPRCVFPRWDRVGPTVERYGGHLALIAQSPGGRGTAGHDAAGHYIHDLRLKTGGTRQDMFHGHRGRSVTEPLGAVLPTASVPAVATAALGPTTTLPFPFRTNRAGLDPDISVANTSRALHSLISGRCRCE